MTEVKWKGRIERRHEVAEVFHYDESSDVHFQKPVIVDIRYSRNLHFPAHICTYKLTVITDTNITLASITSRLFNKV